MICCKTKPWGNSLGIIIPRDIAKSLEIKPGEEVCLEITKKSANPLKDLFGSGKFRQGTKEMLKEVRKNESKFI